MKEKLDFIISSLDMHLAYGKSPQEALVAAIEDYAYVYAKDGRSQLAKASERALRMLSPEEFKERYGRDITT